MRERNEAKKIHSSHAIIHKIRFQYELYVQLKRIEK